MTIPAGDDSNTGPAQNFTVQPNTVYWFAPGTHTLASSGEFGQFNAVDGDTFVGAPGAVIDGRVTFRQNNHFKDNTYQGPWSFWAWSQSNLENPVSWGEWTGAVTDQCGTSSEIASGDCSGGFGQDSGSTVR